MPQNRDAIISAFRQGKFRWRTAEGISRDSGLPVKAVRKFLESSPEIVRAKKGNISGKALYATREKAAQAPPTLGTRASSEVPRSPVKCLVLLPFDQSVEPFRRAIDAVLRQHAIEPLSIEERSETGALWVDGVLSSLRASDFLIADVTRNNPNVLFELGMAHGLGKPFVLLVSAHSDDDIPSDLLGYQYIAYDPSDISHFQARLNRFVGHMASRLKRAI